MAAACVASAALLALGASGAGGADVSAALLQLAQAVPEAGGAFACALVAGHVRGRARTTWILFAVGLGLWAATDLAYGVVTLDGREIPEVSAFDAGWLAFYAAMLPGVAMLYGRLRPERGWQGALDGLTVVLSLGVLAWITVLGPAASGAEGGTLGSLVALVYPSLDLLAAAALAWVLFRHGRIAPVWLWWIGGALGLQVAGGVAYVVAQQAGYAASSELSATTYAAAGLLWMLAALERLRRPERTWSPGSHSAPPAWTRGLPVAMVGTVFTVVALTGGAPPLVGLAAAACAVSVVRVVETLTITDGLLRERDRLLTVDALTGAFNRRFLDDELARAVSRSERSGDPLSVIAFDLDHFKRVNDSLGHGAGDDVLRAVVATTQRTLRIGEVLCRLGGDEFIVIVPGADDAQAHTLAERLGDAIEAATEAAVPGAGVTASLGVASLSPRMVEPQDLIDAADAALYAAKATGRNRVVSAPA
jgi:diguanylate cyclase (GGDEF)-like protein